jgi:hypothetical protein
MRMFLARLIRRIAPMGVVEQRRHTETIIRGMFEKYRGRSLEDEFRRVGVEEHESDVLFDEIDLRFGEALASHDMKKMGGALDGASLLVAGFVMEKQG